MKEDSARELAEESARRLNQDNELFAESVTERGIEWDGLTVKSVETENDFGAGLRIYEDCKPGFSYANHSEFSPERLVEQCRKVQKFNSEDPDLELPEPPGEGSGEAGRKWYDDQVENNIDRRKKQIEDVLQPATDQEDVRTLQVQFNEKVIETRLFRNGRAMVSHDRTSFKFTVWAICEKDGDVQTGFEHQGGSEFQDLDLRRVCDGAIDRARKKLGAQSPPSHEGPLILTDSAASRLLGLVRRMVNGESVVKGRSNWGTDRIGEQIGGSNVTIVDDPSLSGGASNREYDDEGYPLEPVTIMRDGVYKQFLTNHYVSERSDTQNNHRAARSYRNRPSVGSTNFYLQPGDSTVDELKDQLDTGPVVTDIQPGSGMDPIAGFFSVGASGYWLRDGDSTEPFDEATLAGEVNELLSGIEALGNQLPPGYRTASPPLLVESLSLGGD